jgi:leucyl-tRNA synthetase
MKRYNPKEIEPKWQQIWEKSKIYHATEDKSKPKKYVLEYFPYPSGVAMHVGHVRNYTIGDVISRSMRMQGNNVLHPMGWDAFGLPAENYAIKTGISPQEAVAENVTNFKRQLMQMGFSYDWAREINSSDPNYYKWTQWLFLLLFKRGLAYQKESLQWWCPFDKTVLANEQVEDGRCWRCGNEVEKKALKQWFFKITDYADRLESDLGKLDWSESIKTMQRNWMGKSRGAEIEFKITDSKDIIKVFTTRADTIFSAAFIVLAPEHPLVGSLTTADQKPAVEKYVKEAERKSEIDRMETDREKTGIFTGSYATNPANGEKIPIWVADFVLSGYGTGAVFGDIHDERDFEFIKKFNIPARVTVLQDFGKPLENEQYVEGCVVIPYDPNTGLFLGLSGWTKGTGLVGGGREKEETFEKCARRELSEEAGIEHIEKLIQLGDPHYSHYFNDIKKINRRAFTRAYLAIVDSKKVIKATPEAHETFKPEWQDMGKIRDGITKLGGGIEHWLEMCNRAEKAVEAHKKGEEYKGECYSGEGILIDSGEFSGMRSEVARDKIITWLKTKKAAKEQINYKIRDWLISRQRYWGAPIPIIHCPKDGLVPVPEGQLPVELPKMKSYEPNDDGRSPLARMPEFANATCPNCGGPARRETDTMDGFACSSWYFLRFADPHNKENAFSRDKADFWLPVDDYIGGAEHAVMHLLYARFWTKVMFDEGLIDFDEPFTSLRNHGMILAPDGQKMSKSKNNTIEPDGLIEQGYGADAIRLMELFIGPWNQSAAWSVEGLGGTFRFLQRVWTLVQEFTEAKGSNEAHNTELEVQISRPVHKAIKKVSKDIEELGFNTAIAALMECVNELYKIKGEHNFILAQDVWKQNLEKLLLILAPFAPHVTEELWQDLGHGESVHISKWPAWDEKLVAEDIITIAIQINGKVRAEIVVASEAGEKEIIETAKSDEKIKELIAGKEIKREIYVPGRLVNLVI